MKKGSVTTSFYTASRRRLRLRADRGDREGLSVANRLDREALDVQAAARHAGVPEALLGHLIIAGGPQR